MCHFSITILWQFSITIYKTELKIAVLKSPKEKKYSQARWDGPLVSKYVKDEYDVEISIRQAQRTGSYIIDVVV